MGIVQWNFFFEFEDIHEDTSKVRIEM
jgi:hypothetical protein